MEKHPKINQRAVKSSGERMRLACSFRRLAENTERRVATK